MRRTPHSSLRQGLPVSLHGHEKGHPRIYPSLKGRRKVDVAIVGGGMTGALVASTFAAADVSVCLVEAGLVGRGSTAASSALLLQEPDHGMAQLAERYGRSRSARIWQLSHDAVRDFIKTLKRLKIACELDRPVRAGERRDERFAVGTRELREDFERLFPALADIGIDDAWEGLFAMTPDSLPYIGPHRRYPGHLFALGYGGNGMTFEFIAAGILLEQWLGIRSPDHRLFHFGRMRSVQQR
jgi:glycine/D-amino acid oxidase-like deaminating enzyme